MNNQDQLVEYAKKVYEKLQENGDVLTGSQIEELLGQDKSMRSRVVSILSETPYAKKYYNGLKLDAAVENPPALIEKEIITHTNSYLYNQEESSEEDFLEDKLYRPLQNYLKNKFNHVDIAARLRGTRWQNADLVAISYQKELQYHSGIELRVTAFEVKRTMVTRQCVQQAASYLEYANAAYLCYVHLGYRGKNANEIEKSLKEREIWGLLETTGIGLIVVYFSQKQSERRFYSPQFQIIRAASHHDRQPSAIERGIELWAHPNTQRDIRSALSDHIAKAMQAR